MFGDAEKFVGVVFGIFFGVMIIPVVYELVSKSMIVADPLITMLVSLIPTFVSIAVAVMLAKDMELI
ncbi:MAG: hypothetical protein AM325_016390 [Candidatus Thorarchaeota archaeon SMTZ1-45]